MIIVNLKGGLGNQMFQYAAVRGLSKQNEYVYLDHQTLLKNNSDTEHFTARSYELGIFKNIKARKANSYQVKLLTSSSILFKTQRFFLNPIFIKQKANEYISFPERFRFCYFDGYFQSEKYFKHMQRQLSAEFEFPPLDIKNESLKTQIINAQNAVSIHIRRGDYLKSPFIFDVHGVLPVSYYHKAWQILKSTYSALSIFIFSDDINWAKANLKLQEDNIYFISGNDSNNSWKDMALMSSCKHHIIANSSFSWWGAWLSNNNGKVIAPDRWFNPANVNFNIHDFIPYNWTILNVE